MIQSSFSLPASFTHAQMEDGSILFKDSSLYSEKDRKEFKCPYKELILSIARIFYSTHSPYENNNVRLVCKFWYQMHKNAFIHWPELVIAKTIIRIQAIQIPEIRIMEGWKCLESESIKSSKWTVLSSAEACNKFLGELSSTPEIKHEQATNSINRSEVLISLFLLNSASESRLAFEDLLDERGNCFILKYLLICSNNIPYDIDRFVSVSLKKILDKVIIWRDDLDTKYFFKSLNILKNTPYSSYVVDSICNFFSEQLRNINKIEIENKDEILMFIHSLLFDSVMVLCCSEKEYKSFENDLICDSVAQSFLMNSNSELSTEFFAVQLQDQMYVVDLDKIDQIPFVQIRLYILNRIPFLFFLNEQLKEKIQVRLLKS